MAIKFSKQLKWLEPFVNEVHDLVPTNKVKRIVGFKVNKLKEEQVDAAIIKYSKKDHTISLRTHSQKFKVYKNGTRRVKKYDKTYIAPLLQALAHELSHLTHWEHTVDHLSLELKIMTRFVRVLKKYKCKNTWGRIP